MPTLTTATNPPPVANWFQTWESSFDGQAAQAFTAHNIQEYETVPLNRHNYGQSINMSVISTLTNGNSHLWWGYNSQVNFKTALTNNQILQSWLSTKGQYVGKSTRWLNFMCQHQQAASSTQTFVNTCGQNDLTHSAQGRGVSAANFIGD